MNVFKKYCPNVFIAECETEYQKGDIIELTTKYGKDVQCEVFNFISKSDDKYLYSIVRVEDMSYAERKAERYLNSAEKHNKKAHEYNTKANIHRDFLVLGEPIKVGHHSEKRHRKIIEDSHKNLDRMVESFDKVEIAKRKAEYWERKSKEINLSMPESLDYFSAKLELAKEYHQGVKSGKYPREHSYTLTYATKDVKELTKKVELAEILWG